jgi:thiosulfate dehydrogenase [quinone] large subunit
MNMQKIVWLKLRIVMSFIFLWAFFDKLFGLGFATTSEKAWINGGSPTTGFLSMGVKGPLAPFFHSLAGVAVVDWLFMAGLLFIGLTLLLNKYVFWGALAGMVLMILMWLALLFPENNPLIDEHIVYALVFALFAIRSKNTEFS